MRRLRQFQSCGGSAYRSDVTGPNRTFERPAANGSSEPEVTDAVALTKVRFFQLRSISIQQFNYLFEKAGFLLGLMLSNKTALL
jgi:hypothetical protein